MAIQGSILGSLGNAVGIGSSNSHISTQDAYMNAMNQAQNGYGVQTSRPKNMYQFHFEEIENGWVIIYGGKKWMVADLEELSQRVVAIMVELKLEK